MQRAMQRLQHEQLLTNWGVRVWCMGAGYGARVPGVVHGCRVWCMGAGCGAGSGGPEVHGLHQRPHAGLFRP
eukprot:365580-Chlamydomonas_euryale.AAC.16